MFSLINAAAEKKKKPTYPLDLQPLKFCNHRNKVKCFDTNWVNLKGLHHKLVSVL